MEQKQPVLDIPIKAKISGTGVVRKADGSISYAPKPEVNPETKEKDNGRNT